MSFSLESELVHRLKISPSLRMDITAKNFIPVTIFLFLTKFPMHRITLTITKMLRSPLQPVTTIQPYLKRTVGSLLFIIVDSKRNSLAGFLLPLSQIYQLQRLNCSQQVFLQPKKKPILLKYQFLDSRIEKEENFTCENVIFELFPKGPRIYVFFIVFSVKPDVFLRFVLTQQGSHKFRTRVHWNLCSCGFYSCWTNVALLENPVRSKLRSDWTNYRVSERGLDE